MESGSILLVLFCAASSMAQTNYSGLEFSCPPLDANGTAASVHELRPTDIRVIGAMGNSLTAGFATLLNASEIATERIDFRGLSWSGGMQYHEQGLLIAIAIQYW